MTATQLSQPSTPPCVLDAVDQCDSGDEICLRAIGLLLLSQPELVGRIDSLAAAEPYLRQRVDADRLSGTGDVSGTLVCLLAISQLLNKTGRTQEAEACYQQAIDTIVACSVDADQMAVLADELCDLLQKAGQEDKARAVNRRLQVQSLMARADGEGLLSLRNLAFDAFRTGRYAEAERIYRRLLAHNFELAGTWCHLARVLLLTQREAEAVEAVASAWPHRADAVPYVLVRIHYLRALLATLAGQDAAGHLSDLTESLRTPASHCTWLMTPVLDALRPRLTAESHAFFTRLADTLSDRVT